MDTSSLHQFLTLYTWFPLAVLLAFMLLIGRFYQKFSGERTFFWLYLLTIVLFGAFFVRVASSGIVRGDLLADAISIISGGFLIFLSLLLYLRMMRTRNE